MKNIKRIFQPVSFTNSIHLFFKYYFVHKGELLQLYITIKTCRQYREHKSMKYFRKEYIFSPNNNNYCMNLHNFICFCLLCSAWIPQYKGDEKHYPLKGWLSMKREQTHVCFKQSLRRSCTKRKVAWFLR